MRGAMHVTCASRPQPGPPRASRRTKKPREYPHPPKQRASQPTTPQEGQRKNAPVYHHEELLQAAARASPTDGTSAAQASSAPPASALPPGGSREGSPASVPPPLSRKPEVLAPAGGWPQLRAAVENGADAVYFGLSDFNARARASNFEPRELPEIMAYLHDRGAKGYVVLNVLVFDEELALVEERARQMAAAGVDAVIVQDLGAVELIRRAAPSLPIHGSTQMSITSREGARFAAELGVSRVVVGRELSIQEIARMRQQKPPAAAAAAAAAQPAAAASAAAEAGGAAAQPAASAHPLEAAGVAVAVEGVGGENNAQMPEIEAFVHGALCVSYSGQCFSSEAWGGRSANRGQCAQACRMPYGLLVNGELRDLQDLSYLLSPQDLAAVELVPELVRAGVSCFKIEGRLKGPEYVALTTAVYRRAVDAAWEALAPTAAASPLAAAAPAAHPPAPAGTAGAAGPAGEGRLQLSEEEWRDLRTVFARGQDGANLGLTPGFLQGPRHQELVRGRAPRHRGSYAGRVLKVTREGVVMELACEVKRGDGIAFDRGDPQSREEGGLVYEILTQQGGSVAQAPEGARVQLVFGRGQVSLNNVRPGDLAWRNKDPALEARLRASYESLPAAQQRRLPVAVAVSAAAGQPLRVVLTDPEGRRGEGATPAPAAAAEGRGIGPAEVQKAVGVHLGDEAPLVAAAWDFSGCDFAAGLFVPASAIKETRRQAVAALLAARREGRPQAAWAAAAAGQEEAGGALPVLLEAVQQRGDTWRLQQCSSSSSESGAGQEGVAGAGPGGAPVLRVLCRTKAQVEAALQVPWLGEVVLDFLEVHGLKEACAAVRGAGRRLVLATPRVLKPGEEPLLGFYLRLAPDALLLRSAGALQQLADMGGPGAPVPGAAGGVCIPALEGDFSLNAANALSADLLLGAGLARLAPTHDCNAAQIEAMARALGPRAGLMELILHHHLPIFHTEYCAFARFLSQGNSFRDCGHPCEKNSIHLRDSSGADHLVLADQGCRNTVFNASAQTGLPFLPALLAAGLRTFRIELVDEPAQHVGPLLEAYRRALDAAGAVAAQQGQHGQPPAQAARARKEWEAAQREAWALLAALPDANGRAHGAGLGSLEVRSERAVGGMKATAAALKERQRRAAATGAGSR